MSTPIYYVIAENKPIYPGMWSCYHILKVIPCDFEEDNQSIYEREVAPLYNDGVPRLIQTFFVAREPDNPFREKANEKEKSVWDI